MIGNTFSQRLRLALEKQNMRQVELCRKTNIGKSAMSQYIGGAFLPKHDKLVAIANALDVSEAWLMGHDEYISTSDDKNEMQVVALDDNMRGAHIPKGAEIRIDTGAVPKPGDIVCYSSGEDRNRIRVYSKENGKIIFTASELNCRPVIFGEEDLKNGNLQIHGVANKVMIKL